MQTLTTALIAPSARRLLRPARLVRRLRPVRLGVAAQELEELRRTAAAYGLIERFFPDAPLEPGGEWYDVLRDFLRLVEAADWFPIDWGWLDDLFMMAQQTGIEEEDGTEPDGLRMMAEYIEGVPVDYRGLWAEEEDPEDVFYTYPEMVLIAGLLGHIEYDDQLVALVGDDIDGNGLHPATNLALFAERAAEAPEPLCWLPEMARFGGGKTGNKLLDTRLSHIERYEAMDLWSWGSERDLAHLRKLWQEAKPLWEKIEKFNEWGQSPDNQARIARILLGCEDTNDDN